MKPAIIVSRKDTAGMNIASFISNIPIYYVDTEIIYPENIDKNEKIKSADFIIFASKHQGKQEKMLSLHAPGNWKQADFGGQPGKICKTSAAVLKTFFQELNENIPKGWLATLEVTHHGPYIETPCLFIEVGSNETDWKNKQAAKAIAITIENAIKRKPEKHKVALGIGGKHYCQSFNKIQLNSEYAISHIIPQYSFPLTKEMLKEAINKTKEKVSLAIIDWKGLNGEQRQQTKTLLEEINLPWKKTSEIEK